jgi:ATP-dependent DNA helicase RecG
MAAATHSSLAARAAAGESARAAVRAFASTRVLSWEEMIGAALRWPRPALLERPLDLPAGRMARALRALGLGKVGQLLEHLPSDSRQARTVATLRPGEQATVAVRVRAISSRPVRRRGMRPLVQATVADASASMRATFFNQPWLVERYPPGTALLLHGKAERKGGFRVSHHAIAGEEDGLLAADIEGAEAVAHYPAAEGVSSTQILTLVRALRPALADFHEPLPAMLRARERMPDRASALAAMHFPRDPEDARCGRVPAAPRSAPGPGRRDRAGRAADAERALARARASVLPDRRPAARDRADR